MLKGGREKNVTVYEIYDKEGKTFYGNCSYELWMNPDTNEKWIAGVEMVNFSGITSISVPLSTLEMLYIALQQHPDVTGINWYSLGSNPVTQHYIKMTELCHGTHFEELAFGDKDEMSYNYHIESHEFKKFFEKHIQKYVGRF